MPPENHHPQIPSELRSVTLKALFYAVLKSSVVLVALAFFLPEAMGQQVMIKGYATIQTLEDEEERPAGNVIIKVDTDDGSTHSTITPLSGTFTFNLNVEANHLVEWRKDGHTTKRIFFDFKSLSAANFPDEAKVFEFDVALLEEKFLTEDLKVAHTVARVFWSFEKNRFEYESKNRQDYWDRFKSIQRQYAAAKQDLKSEAVSELIIDFTEMVSWPEGQVDSQNIGIFNDYSLFVQLQMRKDELPADSSSMSVYFFENLENTSTYYSPVLSIIYLDQNSGRSGKELLSELDDGVLLITSGYGIHETMINFDEDSKSSLFEINEIEMTKRGFFVEDELLSKAGFTSDAEEWAMVVDEAQSVLRTGFERTKVLESENSNLSSLNTDLENQRAGLDSALQYRNQQMGLLEAQILASSSQLSSLNGILGSKSNELSLVQKDFDERKERMEDMEGVLQLKEQRLEAFDQILANTNAEIRTREAELSDAARLLENQRLLSYAGVGVAGLVSFLFMLAFKNYRKQKKYAKSNQQQARRLMQQRTLLHEKNSELNDSISYAKRIQDSMLPSLDGLRSMVDDVFIYYQPKDIVAGDFFWIEHSGDSVYFAVADCTGHGVPGAMMSVVCNNALSRAFREMGSVTPSQLLDRTRDFVVEQMSKSSMNVKDGMDIALCKWSPKEKKLQFAGAQNPLWVVTDREISGMVSAQLKNDETALKVLEIKGDKQPIGIFENSRQFVNHELVLEEGDQLYIFSDGFADQFGGRNGKKLKYSLFRELVTLSGDGPADDQKEFLSEYFLNWRGELEQIDDVCVLGMRV